MSPRAPAKSAYQLASPQQHPDLTCSSVESQQREDAQVGPFRIERRPAFKLSRKVRSRYSSSGRHLDQPYRHHGEQSEGVARKDVRDVPPETPQDAKIVQRGYMQVQGEVLQRSRREMFQQKGEVLTGGRVDIPDMECFQRGICK